MFAISFYKVFPDLRCGQSCIVCLAKEVEPCQSLNRDRRLAYEQDLNCPPDWTACKFLLLARYLCFGFGGSPNLLSGSARIAGALDAEFSLHPALDWNFEKRAQHDWSPDSIFVFNLADSHVVLWRCFHCKRGKSTRSKGPLAESHPVFVPRERSKERRDSGWSPLTS